MTPHQNKSQDHVVCRAILGYPNLGALWSHGISIGYVGGSSLCLADRAAARPVKPDPTHQQEAFECKTDEHN
jgi:hypothetical protein